MLNSLKQSGKGAIVLPTGFLTAKSGVEGTILKHIVENHIVYGVISMPSNVFANTGTNVSVVFFDNCRSADKVILIDASKLGEDYQEGNNKKVRLRPEEIDLIVDTFTTQKTVDDFSVAVTYDQLKEKSCSLSAGQYFEVKIEYVDISAEEFSAKMNAYKASLSEKFQKGHELEKSILEQMGALHYD